MAQKTCLISIWGAVSPLQLQTVKAYIFIKNRVLFIGLVILQLLQSVEGTGCLHKMLDHLINFQAISTVMCKVNVWN